MRIVIFRRIQVWSLSKRLPSKAWREYRFWSQLTRQQIVFLRNIHEKQKMLHNYCVPFCNTKYLWEYAIQHGSQYRSYYFVEKSKCLNISLFINAFPLKFRVQENFYVLYQFLASARFQPRDSPVPTHCLKEALVTWPLSASGLLPRFGRTRSGIFSKIRSLGVAFRGKNVFVSYQQAFALFNRNK